MVDQGRSDFCVAFYHESLHTWIKAIVNKFAISNRMALILGVRALRSYLKLICEYELYSLPNKNVSSAKDHGKNFIKIRPPLVRHLLRNHLLSTVKIMLSIVFRTWFSTAWSIEFWTTVISQSNCKILVIYVLMRSLLPAKIVCYGHIVYCFQNMVSTAWSVEFWTTVISQSNCKILVNYVLIRSLLPAKIVC